MTECIFKKTEEGEKKGRFEYFKTRRPFESNLPLSPLVGWMAEKTRPEVQKGQKMIHLKGFVTFVGFFFW